MVLIHVFRKHYNNNTTFQLIVIYQLDYGTYMLAQFNQCTIIDIGNNGRGAVRYSIQTYRPVLYYYF